LEITVSNPCDCHHFHFLLCVLCGESCARLSRVALCSLLPDNALKRFIKNSGGKEMADVSIRPKPNGPYLIDGPVDVYDTAGNKIATDDRPRIALCRCGASSNKPFCDGTHSKIGFQAAETINPESAE